MPRPQPRPTNPFPLVRDTAADRFPLSPGQERLWWAHQLDSSADQYHISAGWRIANGLDPTALSVAFADLVRRHAVLRTKFVLCPDGTVVQEIVDDVRVPVTWAGANWRSAVEQAVSDPFDLSHPPLLRAVVAALNDGGHGLFVAIHHIVTDRWSMDVLPRDLFEFYAAARDGREPDLPELAVQYGDYAAWQRQFVASDVLKAALESWQQTLAGYERLELPADRPRPRGNTVAGRTVTVEASAAGTTAMTTLAWRARANPVIVVTAALNAALAAFADQIDVVIGAMVSDRPRPELQDLVGFFINTVILRTDLSGSALTFRDVITRTRDAWLAADANQDVPLEQIVGAMRAGSGDHRNPIFDVVINHAGDRASLATAPDAPTGWYPDVPVTTRFDISLTTQVVDGRLRATFLYRPALFHETTIAAFATRYLRLLEKGVAAPDRPLSELDLVDDAERTNLWRHNDSSPAPDATIVARVQAHAARTPDARAVVGAAGTLTYRQLNERANQLARLLLSYDVGPERVVGVCLEPTVDRFVVLLAVAKSGAAYFPLDPAFPADRLRFLLSDSGAVLTIASPALDDRIPAGTTPVLTFGDGEPDLSGYAISDLPPAAWPDNLAYLISTSGSTGEPKSVAVSHRALSRLVAGSPSYLDVGAGATFLQAGPLTFDVAVLEWAPLANGGSVVVTKIDVLLADLADIVGTYAVSTLKLISAQLDLLVEQGIKALSGIRQLVVGGDVVSPKSFAIAAEELPGCAVKASYGPTESTVLATIFDDVSTTGQVPIGRAIPHTRMYILDSDLRPVAVGMRGEIYLAGDGLARGYHGRPALTASAFLPDPYGPPGARMYRTGDVGRYLPSGTVDFLGRADTQVKIRGFRIETNEVEQTLLRRNDISSTVVVRAELETGPALVAYVVASAGASSVLDISALQKELGATLPAYLIPDYIIQIPAIPLTVNNKMDRAALPPVTATSPDAPPDVLADTLSNGLEARVAQAWSAVLGRNVPSSADFFECGGHSLLVPRTTAAIRRLLGREVPLRLMMEHRTPAAYTAAILRESVADLGAASREHRLARQVWRGRTSTADQRIDLFVTAAPPSEVDEQIATLVVLDGVEFVDIMRLPAILDRLVLRGRIPMTAAVFLSPTEWAARNRELLADEFADVLADEVVPHLRTWLDGRWRTGPAFAVGASLGAVAALRAALRRPDCFAGAVALSGPLTEHQLAPPAPTKAAARLFLSAGREESDIILDDGLSLLDANLGTAKELAAQGNVVRCLTSDGGHTYGAWEAMLPHAISWVIDPEQDQSPPRDQWKDEVRHVR